MSLASALAAFRNLRLVGVCSKLPEVQVQPRRWRMKENDRRYLISTSPKQESGTAGEDILPVDVLKQEEFGVLYPDKNTPNKLFNGIPFCETPIVHIHVTKNNTHFVFTDYLNSQIAYRTCGVEGFKHARKGTNIAAQATAITVAKQAKAKGVTSIRVKISGLGPGRLASVKGLEMAGMKIISVTDSTPISWNPPRPRKQRRL